MVLFFIYWLTFGKKVDHDGDEYKNIPMCSANFSDALLEFMQQSQKEC